MFFAYALIVITIWGCTSIVAIHFDNPFMMIIAFIGMVLVPSFRQNHPSNDVTGNSDNEKLKLTIKKECNTPDEMNNTKFGRF